MVVLMLLQVTSLLKGEKSLPRTDRGQDVFINDYSRVLGRIKNAGSEFVKVKDSSTPSLGRLGDSQTPTSSGAPSWLQGTPFTTKQNGRGR